MAYDGSVTTSDLAEPNWLDDDEMRLWRSYIEVSVRLVSALDARLKAAAGVSFDDYEVLVHLSEASDRRLRMAELSDRLIHSRSRLTQRIDRLAISTEYRLIVDRHQIVFPDVGRPPDRATEKAKPRDAHRIGHRRQQ